MRGRALLAAGLIGAALCFTLGWLASRVVEAPRREPMATPSSEPTFVDHAPTDGESPDPVLLIDPSTIVLLPDASLRIDPPTAPVLPGQTKVRPD